jgi:AcrR family transcriptional regulator
MANYKKGIEMRQHIISEARKVFNAEGLHLTLDQLAGKLNLTKGRITNYFPTKDDLFVALSQDYDLRFQELMTQFGEEMKVSFEWLVKVFSAVMDLQYEYRSAIIFVATTNSSQKEMHNQITKSYKTNSKQVRQSVESLLKAGLVKPVILDPKIFEVFGFQYVNLFTTWVISLEIYNSSSSYKKMKPVYLKGIFSCYYPYLTKKGLGQYRLILNPENDYFLTHC